VARLPPIELERFTGVPSASDLLVRLYVHEQEQKLHRGLLSYLAAPSCTGTNKTLPEGKQSMPKNTSVIGIYPDRTTVSDAIGVLHKAGYRTTDISVLSSENQGSKDFAHEKHTKALAGAAIGSAAGAAVGAALAWFVCAQNVVPMGLGPFIAAGPVFSALSGAAAGGVLGWVVGSLVGLCVPEYIAKRYAGRIRRGGILVSVHCDSPEWCGRAKKTLKDTGARDISSASESSADYGTTDKPTERAPVLVTNRVEPPAQPTMIETADHETGK
jgi:hypothetical protein